MPQQSPRSGRRHTAALLTDAAKVIVPLAVSAGLVAWMFHKIDFRQVEAIIRHGVDYRFIFAMMGVTVLSHVIRGIRWGIQLRAVGVPRMPVVAESVAIFGAYALNLVFPFLGEAWRCVFVSRRQGRPLSTIVGTDIGDRASDGIMIVLITLLTLVVAHPAVMRFIDHTHIATIMERDMTGPHLIAAAAIAAALAAAAVIFIRRSPAAAGIRTGCARIWHGFAILFHLKGTGLYLILTVGIWLCYFSETYLCFYAFPFTRELISTPGSAWGLIPGLVVFVFGSCSMIVPSNGGLGPWNIAVIFALSLYGVSAPDATAFSIVCWSFQTLTLIMLGIFSAIYIVTTRRRRHHVAATKM